MQPPACARMTPGLARAGCSASQSATLSGGVDDDEPVELATAMTFVDKNKTSSVFALANPHVLLAAGSTSGASPSHRVTLPSDAHAARRAPCGDHASARVLAPVPDVDFLPPSENTAAA